MHQRTGLNSSLKLPTSGATVKANRLELYVKGAMVECGSGQALFQAVRGASRLIPMISPQRSGCLKSESTSALSWNGFPFVTAHPPSAQGSSRTHRKGGSSHLAPTSIVPDQEAREAEKKGPGNHRRALLLIRQRRRSFQKEELLRLHVGPRLQPVEIHPACQVRRIPLPGVPSRLHFSIDKR